MDGLNTVLPFGVRKIDALRTLTTESLAVFIPFRVQEISVSYTHLDTDLIEFSDEDFVGGEADITEHSEDGLDDTDEEELSEEDDCSDCPYFCPVCGECLYEDECLIVSLALYSS